MGTYYDESAEAYFESEFDGFPELQRAVWLSLFADEPLVAMLPERTPLAYARDVVPELFELERLRAAFLARLGLYRAGFEAAHDGVWDGYRGRRPIYLLTDRYLYQSTSLYEHLFDRDYSGGWLGRSRFEKVSYRAVERVLGRDEVAPTRQMKVAFAVSVLSVWLSGDAVFPGRDLRPFVDFWLAVAALTPVRSASPVV